MIAGQEVKHDSLSLKRLAALTLASLLLCLSVVMSFATSLPVALASLLYGRKKGYAAAALAWAFSFILAFYVLSNPLIFEIYTASLFVTLISVETVVRNFSPMKGVFFGGAAVTAAVIGLVAGAFSAADMNIKEFLVDEIKAQKSQLEKSLKQQGEESGDQTLEALAYLEQPEILADKIVEEAPGYFAMGVFLILWANVFLLLKTKRTLLGAREPYTDLDLIQYKNPDHLIWLVIAALALAVWGDQVLAGADALGMGALKVLGVFYFFQGFGLYVSFLDYLNLRGFLRTLLVALTVLMAGQVLALIGLFDMFFNFRKFMRKQD